MDPESVDGYIAGAAEEVRTVLAEMRRTIREAVPEAEETLCYRMPTYRLEGRNLVHFATFRHHVGYYPTPSAIEAFADELTAYVTSKGAIRFPLGEPIPHDLVRRIAAFRAGEVRAGKR